MFHKREMRRRMRAPHRHGWEGDFGHWGRGRHGGGRRMFDQGDLRLVVLALLGVERVDGLLDRLLAIRTEIAEQEKVRRDE